ncbi:MAG: hypothetical protein WC870_02900 [Candidatus Paceibacterota bacterium]
MNKKTIAIGILALVLFVGFSVYAAGQSGGISGPGTGLENQDASQELQIQQPQDTSGAGVQVQNQNQIQNEGETSQIQNREQEETQNQSELAVTEQRKSTVANAVQGMLQVAERNGGIGQQVKVIAQNQNQNQEKLEVSLAKVQDRGGFAKFFIGPNYGEIENAEKILEQNREQVRQLNELKNQLVNQGDEQVLTQQIQALEQANLEIENSLKVERKGFSLFGWLFN